MLQIHILYLDFRYNFVDFQMSKLKNRESYVGGSAIEAAGQDSSPDKLVAILSASSRSCELAVGHLVGGAALT